MNAALKHILGIILVALFLGLGFGVETSQALEPIKVFRGVLVLEGKIGRGDYDRLRNFLVIKSNFEKISNGVFLASPGGYIAEAMKIGRLIRALRLSTDAPAGPLSGIPMFGESLIAPNNLVDPRSNYLCASACFLVYVSGIYRHLNWVGRLGIHRPTHLESNLKELSVDQELDLTWRIRTAVKQYLKEMDVPDKYVDLMYSVPPNQVRWITQKEFTSDFQGFVPEFKDWVGAKCGLRSGRKDADALSEKSLTSGKTQAVEKDKAVLSPASLSVAMAECWAEARAELANEAWGKTFSQK